MIQAGAAKIDITPAYDVWMDGMIRAHKSEGVHDPLYARAMALSDGGSTVVFISVDVCGVTKATVETARTAIQAATGIPAANVLISATHTHSGPATVGHFNAAEADYVDKLVTKLAVAASESVKNLRPASIACGSGREDTISFYRRFRSKDGRTVMLWEENPAENDLTPLGEPDPEVGVVRTIDASNGETIAVLFNHAGHPNVMSGDNYLLSPDYPGVAERAVEAEFGGVALFINGAQGTMDIDNWTYRDWDGVEHIGKALANAVTDAAAKALPSLNLPLSISTVNYKIPPRKISDEEIAWAKGVLAATGGAVASVADGVGDDYKATLYKRLRERESADIAIEQACVAIGDTALISFPGELFTEIGMRIKAASPFARTYILGLTNGSIGYVPTKEAIPQRGYEVDTRAMCDDADDIIVARSLALLDEAHKFGGNNV